MGVYGTSSTSWFDFADCRVHSIEFLSAESEGAAVLFIHGRYGDASQWRSIAEGLEGAARCICIDLPGFGLSYTVRSAGLSLIGGATLVQELIAELPPEIPLVLVGHDIGGTIALISAIRLANRISGLVLIGPACLTCPPAGLNPGLFAAGHLRRLRTLSASSRLLSPAARRKILEPWHLIPIRRSRGAALRALAESWPRQYERLAWKRAIKSLSCPTRLIWGGEDRLARPELGLELLRLLPEAELFQHPQGSHWIPLETPSWVAMRIREFLYQLGGVSARRSLSR